MSDIVTFIAHPQSIELRLQVDRQQTSFTLALQVANILPKTLSKIESWCLEYLDTYTTYRVIQGLRQTNVQDELQRARALSLDTQAQVSAPSYAVCDYSTQGKWAVWGCVITHQGRTIRCCGQVPAGQRGEQYAIERTHQYLKHGS